MRNHSTRSWRLNPTGGSRGFSLIEILVALTMSIVIVGITLGVLQSTFRSSVRERARSRLAREAQFVHLAIQRSLNFMGTGVPRASHIDTSHSTEIPTSVLIARAEAVGILGDLPRPHAQYNTFGWLHPEYGNSRRRIAWHTENNGACVPGAASEVSGGACDAEDFSTFFPGDGAAKCDSNGDEDSRLCAWGVRRLEENDHFQIASGTGSWTDAEFGYGGIDTFNGTAFFELDSDYNDPDGSWPNDAPGAMPVGAPGAGFVTTLDRIFYEINGTSLIRTQCWGDPDISNANWPVSGTNPLPSTLTLTNAVNFNSDNHECTPGEVLSSKVVAGSSAFSFFDVDGNVTAVNEDIRRVDYYILLRETTAPYGDVLEYPIVGSVGFRNPGMATTSTVVGSPVPPPIPPSDD